jgi:hypothetical protein
MGRMTLANGPVTQSVGAPIDARRNENRSFLIGILRPHRPVRPTAGCAHDRASDRRSMSACIRPAARGFVRLRRSFRIPWVTRSGTTLLPMGSGGGCYRPANGATWATNPTMRRAALRSGSRSGL